MQVASATTAVLWRSRGGLGADAVAGFCGMAAMARGAAPVKGWAARACVAGLHAFIASLHCLVEPIGAGPEMMRQLVFASE